MDWEILAKIMSSMGQGQGQGAFNPGRETERAMARSGQAAAGPPPPMREMDRPRTPRPEHWRTASNPSGAFPEIDLSSPPGALPEIDLSGPSTSPTPTPPKDFAQFLLGQGQIPGVGMFGTGPEGGQTVFHPEGQDPGVLVNYGPPGLQTSVSANLTPQQLEIISELQRIFQGGSSQIGTGPQGREFVDAREDPDLLMEPEEAPAAQVPPQPDLMSMARRVAGRGRRP